MFNQQRATFSSAIAAAFMLFSLAAFGENDPGKKPHDPGHHPHANYQEAGPYGGKGGSFFTDNLAAGSQISSISIRAGSWIDQISVTYKLKNGSIKTFTHGGTGGTPQPTISFADDEYITEIKGRSGIYLDQITFVTNKNTYGPFGGTGGSPFTLSQKVAGFFGRSGVYVDALGFLYQ